MQNNETVYIYSLINDSGLPYTQCNFLFVRKENKLRWLVLDKNIRSCCIIGKGIGIDFDDIDDFINYIPHLKNLGLKYQEVRKSLHGIGEYYNHIYRPVFSYKLQDEHIAFKDQPYRQEYEDLDLAIISERNEYIRYIRQLEIIFDELTNVFKVIEPSSDNMNVYGNALRNIIILSCTEIDAMLRNILKSNGYKNANDNYSTNDYIKLKDILKINEYELSLDFFESLGPYSPFKEWDKHNPTTSIPWYDAYNKIKHNRDQNFAFASLSNAINSIVAFAIVLMAQYGWDNTIWKQKFANIFKINKVPRWNIEEFYIPFSTEHPQVAINHPNLDNTTTLTEKK